MQTATGQDAALLWTIRHKSHTTSNGHLAGEPRLAFSCWWRMCTLHDGLMETHLIDLIFTSPTNWLLKIEHCFIYICSLSSIGDTASNVCLKAIHRHKLSYFGARKKSLSLQIADHTDTLNSQTRKATINNNMWNIWQLWSNEIVDDMLLWTNTMKQHVEIMTAAIRQYISLAAFITQKQMAKADSSATAGMDKWCSESGKFLKSNISN